MTIGEKIFELRKEKGVSQETMAFELNVSRQAVSKWETDQSIPDLDKIKSLAEYFNVSIDYIVNDVNYNEEIIEKENVDLNKYNIVKRFIMLMLKTVIGLNILYFVYILTCTVFQGILIYYFYGREIDTFFVPWAKIIEYLFVNGAQILLSFLMLTQLNEDSKKYKDKIVYLVTYIIGSLFISQIIGFIESKIITKLSVSSSEVVSSMIVVPSINYFYLINLIDRYEIICSIFSAMFIISIVLMIVVRYNDYTKYKLPLNKKEYKASDSVLSFLNALFLGIPGLIFQVFWCLDAKCDNEFRFKKMRFWYIMGAIVSVLIYIILVLIKVL